MTSSQTLDHGFVPITLSPGITIRMDMLKKLILIAAVAVVGLSGYLLYHDKRHQEAMPKDETVFEIPVTTTQVTPGLEVK